jgi:CheY-like chemotaxis protein
VPNSTDNHGRLETKKKTVMICDDEPDVLLSFELMLKPSYDVIMTGSGKECIEKYIKEKLWALK